MTPPKKRLKARHPVMEDKRPHCPLHPLVKMEFVVEELRWECGMHGCVQVVFPKAVISGGRPILGRGELELFEVLDGDTEKFHYLLRSADNNVMIDVTAIAEKIDLGHGTYAEVTINVPLVKAV